MSPRIGGDPETTEPATWREPKTAPTVPSIAWAIGPRADRSVASSASTNATSPPRAANTPVRTAAPLPWLVPCSSTRSIGKRSANECATSTVLSVLPSSTTSTSVVDGSVAATSEVSTAGNRRSSFHAGTTTVNAMSTALRRRRATKRGCSEAVPCCTAQQSRTPSARCLSS